MVCRYVWSHSDCLQEFDGVFAKEACEELESLLLCDVLPKRTYVVQEQVFELIVTFFFVR